MNMLAQMMRYENGALPKNFDDRFFGAGHPMMYWVGGTGGWIFGLLWLVTWTLAIIVLVALARWLWKKGDKAR